jgi:predicted ATPase/DNA-binding CsgD family transcriptional regulator
MSGSTHPDTPRDPTPIRTVSSASPESSLPRPLTSLVGREEDAIEIGARLDDGAVRLLTLTGPGGVGKTRLAIRVLNDLDSGRFDQIAFVPLAAVRDPDLILPAVAIAMGAPNTPGQPIMTRLGTYLHDHRLILALDNFEHLLDAAPLITDLMTQSESLTVLVTSRTRLNLTGEHVYPVRPLANDASVDLFGQRAKAITPGFDLTPELLPTIDAICGQLDRLPLAIELAAARIAALPPTALHDRLSHPLPLLTGGPRDAPDRQRTMRSVIAWSNDLLPGEVQVLFRRLGVFVGGFTLDAAAAVTGAGTDVLAGLEALIASSLLNTSPAVGGVPRFAMLETIREFALDQLTEHGEDAGIRSLHARYFAAAIEAELPNQDGPDLRGAHDRNEADLQNCRAALTWSLERGEAEIGIRLAGALWRTWRYVSTIDTRPWLERITEGRAWLARTLAMREGLPLPVLVEALAGAAQLAAFTGDVATAQAWGDELETRVQAEPLAYGRFWSGFVLGHLAADRQDYETSRRMYLQAIQAASAIRNPESGQAQALNAMANMNVRAGDDVAAITSFERALPLARTAGNPFAIAMVAGDYGRFLHERGDLPRAVRLLSESVDSLLDQRFADNARSNVAAVAFIALETGRTERAATLLAAAEPIPNFRYYGLMPIKDDTLVRAAALTEDATWVGARAAGLAMGWDAIRTELEDLAQDLETRPASIRGEPRAQLGLTRRELEVTKLLADGRSNRAIADALCISDRTVAHHVLHILTKLNLESRSAVAAFAVRNHLD